MTRDVRFTPLLAGIETAALGYTENDPATPLTSLITVSDAASAILVGATIQIVDNYHAGEDVLSFADTTTITGSWNATTGTLTLTGSDTVANYQAALRTVTYQNTSDDPSAAVRTVSLRVGDGVTESNIVTRSIAVTPVDDAPELAGVEAGTLAAYIENDPPTPIVSTITINDVDNTSMAGATVQIADNYQAGEDVLSFADTATITGTWNAATGTLTLAGADTVANYQAALRAVKYQNTSDNPSTATRTVSFSLSDGAADSNVVTRNITVVVVDDPPVLADVETAALGYTENDPAMLLTSTITVSDVDSTNLVGATVSIDGNYQDGQDVLSFTDTATITGTWNAATGTLTLAGSDTLANYQAALRAVKYQNTSDNPSTATRTVSFKVNDGELDSNVLTRTITVTAVNDAPELAGIEAAALGYTENEAAASITSTITVGDVDSTSLAGAAIWIAGNYQNGQDVLSFTDTATITGTWNAATGTLTLTGTDTLANYQAALRTVKYQNTSDNPSAATRTVNFKVNDGAADSNVVTRDVAVAAVNDAPAAVRNRSRRRSAYTENEPATSVTSTITVGDVDNANLASAAIQIATNYQAGEDVLSFTDTATITGAWNAATGTLTLTGSDTVADYQAALRAVQYHNTSDTPSAATRTVSFVVSDGTAQSNVLTRDITVTPVDDAPVLAAIEEAALAYTEQDPAAILTSTITVSDVDSTSLAGATIQITGNYQAGQDVLSFADTATITGSWNATTGTLTLAGSDTLANYQAALRAVKYQNASDNPGAAVRTVSFTVSDGTSASNVLTRSIAVTPVNDAPVLTTSSGTVTYAKGSPATAIDPALTVSDVDNTTLAGATIQITGNYQNGQDVLSFTDTADITATWNAATGTLTLTGADTVANYQAALRSVAYHNTGTGAVNLVRTISFIANDGGAANNLSAPATRTVTVTNVAPVVDLNGPGEAGNNFATTFVVSVGPTLIADSDATLTDADDSTLSSLTVTISNVLDGASEILSADVTGTSIATELRQRSAHAFGKRFAGALPASAAHRSI